MRACMSCLLVTLTLTTTALALHCFRHIQAPLTAEEANAILDVVSDKQTQDDARLDAALSRQQQRVARLVPLSQTQDTPTLLAD